MQPSGSCDGSPEIDCRANTPALDEGPIHIGDIKDMGSTKWLSMAGTYVAAFTAGAKTYPYLRSAEG